MVTFTPPDAPCQEEYWQALIEDGENGSAAAPPIPASEIWAGLAWDTEPRPKTPTTSSSGDGTWGAARQAMEAETWLELTVVGYNRGGLLVEMDSIQGFVPASHLADMSPYLDEREREQELQARLGERLQLKVIEVDPPRSRLVLSECATRSDEELRQAFLHRLSPGDVCRGQITNICSFGAFVDLGGVEGLVHISEIAWGRVQHPSELLRPGDEVKTCVLNVDHDRGRVGLSIKRTQPDPWQTIEERYNVGQVLEALITNVVDFGAFAQVEEGVEGLIHVSELAEGGFLHPRNVIHEGEWVQVCVINMDSERRRMGLSLRQLASSDQP